jgi:DNA invertase Pin-like site-specific DNA recombinase
VFKEKVGGAKTDRAELAKLLSRIEPGDVLIVPVSTGWRAGPETCARR